MEPALKIKELRTEAGQAVTVVFERPQNFSFEAGQWLDLYFADEGEAAYKTFSFSSAPTEPDIAITFNRGVSAFKRRLQAMTPGETMQIYRVGGAFRLDARPPALLLAGGVGMAVLRPMLKEALDLGRKLDAVLVYVNGSDAFLFKEELESWPIRSILRNTKTDGRLTAKQLAGLVPDLSQRHVYIAGPPAMVHKSQDVVRGLGVPEYQIFTDAFDGY